MRTVIGSMSTPSGLMGVPESWRSEVTGRLTLGYQEVTRTGDVGRSEVEAVEHVADAVEHPADAVPDRADALAQALTDAADAVAQTVEAPAEQQAHEHPVHR